MTKSGFVTIGKVIKPRGLKGEVSIVSYADSPFLFEQIKRIYIKKKDSYLKKFWISGVRFHKNMILLKLDDIIGRDEVKHIQNAEIWVRKRDLPEKDIDEVFIKDLLGCMIYLPDKTYVGSICDVITQTNQEVWVIEGKNGQEILFPVTENFIQEMDIESRIITIDPPKGLLELYEAQK